MKKIKCYLEITILGKDPELVKDEDFSPKTLILSDWRNQTTGEMPEFLITKIRSFFSVCIYFELS